MRKIILIFSALAVLQACNLDLAPENVMVDQNVYSHAKTSQAALMGAYSRMNIFIGGAPEDQNNYSYVSLLWMAGDIGTDNLKVRDGGSSDFISLENCSYDNTMRDGAILTSWKKGYNAIDYANNVIDGIERYGNFDEALENQYVAEAKVIRGFVYFNLLKMFGDGALTGNGSGLGLILRDKPYDGYNPDQVMARSTVDQTWDFIISDLETSLAALPDSPGLPEGRFRATKPTAWALLSRVYLYRGSYTGDADCMQKAADYANQVLESGAYSFSTQYNDHKFSIFPANEYSTTLAGNYPNPTARSGEIILYQPSRISTELYTNGVSPYYFEKRYFYIEPSFPSTVYLPGDFRGFIDGSAYSLIGQGGTSYYVNDITSLKYSNNAGYDDVVYIRLSEIKLNLAEALTRQTKTVTEEALRQLNDIRCKAFTGDGKPESYKTSDFKNSDELLDAILLERQRELAFESHHRWDLIRTGRKLRNASVPSSQMILPIPDYEVTISKGVIEQNTGFR